MPKIQERKIRIVNTLCESFAAYKNIIVVALDNVSTKQIQNARAKMFEKYDGRIIVGKNSLIAKALDWVTTKPKANDPNFEQRKNVAHIPALEVLKKYIKLNVGLILTNNSYQDLKLDIESDVISMAAKVGATAPCDVFLPLGPTGVDSGKIDLFHKLEIPVMVKAGNLEIVKPYQMVFKGTRVTESAALMCRTLKMTPFEYTLRFKYVYMNGQVIDENIINMSTEDILSKFSFGVKTLTGLSLAANLPNKLSAPHMIVNGFKKLLALGVVSGHTFKELADAQNAKANAPAAKVDAGEVVEEKPPSEVEESVSMGGLFSDSD